MLGELTILLYHGVTTEKSFGIENYHRKHIPANEFKEQMRFLSENCHVLSMDEVTEHYERRIPFPQHAAAVTFDDGFENNFTTAFPILKQYQIPATFYISSAFIDSDKMFWVDELEDCINLTPEQSIEIVLNEPTHFDLSSNYLKIESLERIKSYCKAAAVKEKNRIMQAVATATRVQPASVHAANYKKITTEQIQLMAADDLCIIGGHSHEHNILSAFEDEKEMQNDIQTSLQKLAAVTGRSVRHYAYPEGQLHHFNQAVINELRKNNIVCCPSAVHGINNGDEDLFYLKRIMVGFKGTAFPFYLKKNALQS